MRSNFYSSFLKLSFLVIALSLFNCAKRGSPTGGPKDEEAPLLVTSKPPYKTTNFKASEIELFFNEYIKLKDVGKQLVVSPPLKYPPNITPQGSASKRISIEIFDTLQPNTTYTFNFGNSIQDNNEGNQLGKFKYVFSTGSYIDSLYTYGKIEDALSKKKLKDIKVLLYRMDSTFNDSIIYKQKPNYVTSTLDSTSYDFTNIQKGEYLLIALQDAVSDYIYDPRSDKIAFYSHTLSLPRDSTIFSNLKLFKEILPFQFKRAKELSKGRIIFGYEGDKKDFTVELISPVDADFKSSINFEKDTDTLNFWYTPIERDSLIFHIKKKTIIDTVVVKLREKEIDSLKITPSKRGTIQIRDTFFLQTNTPISKIDTSKISLIDQDTISVTYQYFVNNAKNAVGFLFEKKFSSNYTFSFLPEAVTDLFNVSNDTLNYKLTTGKIDDFGAIHINLQNARKQQVIVQLITPDEKVLEERIVQNSTTVKFTALSPKEYNIRFIIDNDKNGKWTTGNFLKRMQPEKVFYFPKTITVRPLWENVENFTIE